MSPVVLWVDADAQQADCEMAHVARQFAHWDLLGCRTLDEAAALRALRPCHALVLRVAPGVKVLPDMVGLCAGCPVLLVIAPHQEGLAAQAFRCGLADYAVRTDAEASLDELAQRLEGVLSSGRADKAPTRMVDARTWTEALEQLQEQRSALQVTLGSMSQGIFKTDPAGRVVIYNRRVLELLNLSESFLATRPTLQEITRAQADRGDFGPGYSLVDRRGIDYVAQGGAIPSPELYWRRTTDGRTFEVRTKTLPDGSLVRTFTDVSDYVRVENELRASENRFRSLSDLTSDWYWEHDRDGRFVEVAGDYSRNGLALSDVIGRTRWEIGALNLSAADWDTHRAVLANHQPFRDLELQRRRPDGTLHWISVSGVPILDENGQFCGYRGIGRDISERKNAESQIERLAFFDALTGLPNRRLLIDRLQRATAAAARGQNQGALFFIDLDNFKDLNDTLGHDFGDLLLVEAARRLKGCVRDCDTVARFGGDEFVVLAEDLSAEPAIASAEAALIASHISTTLGRPYAIGDASHHSTPSIGIALFGSPATRVDELLKQADLAMYQAKSAGRNTQRFFDPDMQAAVTARSELEADLRRGLQAHEMVLYYQPVVDASGRMLGAEALVRWLHPRRGVVAPGQFIALAEQTGLIIPLGASVLEAACHQLVAWSRSALTRPFFLSVNVSVRQFRQPDFTDQVLKVLHATGANPERLKLELTESLLLTDVEEVIARMEQLRQYGVGFSLDDFGTGYSSLSYLKRLPLDQLKIDQGFVRDLQSDPNDAAIVRTILALARSLDLNVVAEGVETPGQMEFLKRHGCQAFQGYLLGRPLSGAVMAQALGALSG